MDDQPPPQHAGGSQTTYSDSSGPIFSMYNTRVQKFDEENVENWKGSAESILVFVCIHPVLTVTMVIYLPLLAF